MENVKGANVSAPRVPTISTDGLIRFKRLQFPIRLAFSMTVNQVAGTNRLILNVHVFYTDNYALRARVSENHRTILFMRLTRHIVNDLAL